MMSIELMRGAENSNDGRGEERAPTVGGGGVGNDDCRGLREALIWALESRANAVIMRA